MLVPVFVQMLVLLGMWYLSQERSIAIIAVGGLIIAGSGIWLIAIADHLHQDIAQSRRDNPQLQSIIDSVSGAIICLEIFKNYTWKTIHISAGCERISGYTVSELFADERLWRSRLHPEDLEKVEAQVFENIFAERTATYEYRFLKKDNSWCWIAQTNRSQWSSSKNCWLVSIVSVDISDRKAAEAAHLESEARYHAIVETQTELVVRSTPELVITFVNEATCRLTGYSLQDTIGCHWSQFMSPDVFATVQQNITQLTPEQPTCRHEQYTYLKSGNRWIEWINQGFFDKQGQLIEIQAIGRDIHERKQLEVERQQALEDLKMAKQAAEAANQAKSIFLANMSHELRTPLNAILGYPQLLHSSPNLSAQDRQHLSVIERSGKYLLNLINQILELSKIEAGRMIFHPVQADLEVLLNDIEIMLKPKAIEKRLAFSIQMSETVPKTICTDAVKLQQVLVNLLHNAIKFTTSGSVTLQVDWAATQPTLLQFTVIDTGIGIPPEEQDVLFDSFVQTKSGQDSQEGTGLGLAISQKFVTLLGGELTVQSIVGQGSQFQFAIALEQAQFSCPLPNPQQKDVKILAVSSPSSPETSLPSPSGSLRILLATSDSEAQSTTLNTLKQLGHDVTAVSQGLDVLHHLVLNPHDVVLLDLHLSDLDGITVTEIIRRDHPPHEQPYIVAIAANISEQERTTCLAVGMDDIMTKPLDGDCLKQLLTTFFESRA